MDRPSYGPREPCPRDLKAAWSARMKAREQAAREATARGLAQTVTVEVVLDSDDPGRLGELLAALDARSEFLGPPMGAEVGRVIGVTVMVKARTKETAQQIATVTILDEMQKLGLIGD